MREKRLGQKMSNEQKEKIRLKMKEYWAGKTKS